MKKVLVTVFKIAAIILLLFIGAYFLFRQQLYNYILTKIQNRFQEKFDSRLLVKSISPAGLTGFQLRDVIVIPRGKDTLLNINEIEGNLKLSSILHGKVRFSDLTVNEGWVHAVYKNGQNNYAVFLSRHSDTVSVVSERNYAKAASKMLSLLFASVPNVIHLRNLDLDYTAEEASVKAHLSSFVYDHSRVEGQLQVYEDSKEHKWFINGTIDKRKENFQGKLYADHEPVVIPYIQKKYQVHLAFDTLSFALTENDFDDERLLLKGNGLLENFVLKHPKIDSNEVKIRHLASDYILDIGKNSVHLETPNLYINKILCDIKLGYEKDKAIRTTLQADMKRLPAQDFFNSLPEGLFSTFEGIQTTGDLAYHLNFRLDFSRPDCVVFDSRMMDFGLKIKKFGTVNFAKLNDPFLYTAYEKGKPVKSFVVGSENPEFVPLDQISPYLQSAVLQSEDGSFFAHNGFREDAFKMAIADNVKKGRFARGGSTISMQLVKNVFLSRKKTVARKVEEALIVWLIEKKRLTSKSRMYEVYLNIIEWGPGIYGITEAADFYFSKKPEDLTPEESIFLASIIPRPKGFRYSFDEEGNLKPYLEPYFRKMAELMFKKGIITEEERDEIKPEVKLRGPARDLVLKEGDAGDDDEDDEFFDDDEEGSGKKFFLFNKKKREKKEDNLKNKLVDPAVEKPAASEDASRKKKKWRLFK